MLRDILTMDEREPYAVVEFHDGFEVVKSEWGDFVNNEMVACYFPSNISKLEYMDLLKQTSKNVDTTKWVDENGEPWKIKKLCTYSSKFLLLLYLIKLLTLLGLILFVYF